MKIEANNPDEFFKNAGQWEAPLRELDALIRQELPELTPQLHSGTSITMMGYGVFPYKTKTTQGEWPIIALAPQKNYAALYVCATNNGQYFAEKFQNQLGNVSCGKSCIRFKKFDDLDLVGVKAMFVELRELHKSGATLFGF